MVQSLSDRSAGYLSATAVALSPRRSLLSQFVGLTAGAVVFGASATSPAAGANDNIPLGEPPAPGGASRRAIWPV